MSPRDPGTLASANSGLLRIASRAKGFLQGHFCPPPFSRNRTWTLPLIQLPASKQLAFLYKKWKCGWIEWNRGIRFFFSDMISKSIPFTKTYGSPEERLPLQHLVIFEKIITSPFLECFCRFRKFQSGSGREWIRESRAYSSWSFRSPLGRAFLWIERWGEGFLTRLKGEGSLP